jgi:SAM-dependent methyltransferase
MSEHPGGPYFRTLAETLGEAYLRYDFTRGTSQEVGFLVEALALPAGARILDVGCGPGRHAVALARRGYAVTGVDVSPRFLAIAAERARRAGVPAAFFEVDARVMPFDDEFDAVISLCQGGFGLMGDDDGLVLKRIAEATKAGGTVLLTAFNAYFEIRSSRPGATFDADKGIVTSTRRFATRPAPSARRSCGRGSTRHASSGFWRSAAGWCRRTSSRSPPVITRADAPTSSTRSSSSSPGGRGAPERTIGDASGAGAEPAPGPHGPVSPKSLAARGCRGRSRSSRHGRSRRPRPRACRPRSLRG